MLLSSTNITGEAACVLSSRGCLKRGNQAAYTVLGLEKQALWGHGTLGRTESDNGTHSCDCFMGTRAREHGVSGRTEPYNGPVGAVLKAAGAGALQYGARLWPRPPGHPAPGQPPHQARSVRGPGPGPAGPRYRAAPPDPPGRPATAGRGRPRGRPSAGRGRAGAAGPGAGGGGAERGGTEPSGAGKAAAGGSVPPGTPGAPTGAAAAGRAAAAGSVPGGFAPCPGLAASVPSARPWGRYRRPGLFFIGCTGTGLAAEPWGMVVSPWVAVLEGPCAVPGGSRCPAGSCRRCAWVSLPLLNALRAEPWL